MLCSICTLPCAPPTPPPAPHLLLLRRAPSTCPVQHQSQTVLWHTGELVTSSVPLIFHQSPYSRSRLRLSPVLCKQLKKRGSFASRFIFGSSDFTARTVRRHCPRSLDFIPYRSFTFVVRTASRPATRRRWVTTKGTLSTRVIRRKCFPCVMRPCTMVVHAANNCQQEGSHFAGRDTHVESCTTARPARGAHVICIYVQT